MGLGRLSDVSLRSGEVVAIRPAGKAMICATR